MVEYVRRLPTPSKHPTNRLLTTDFGAPGAPTEKYYARDITAARLRVVLSAITS